ncbi:MAG: helix-turn-helix domain-containing protein [Acidimicrobiales bacterium]
MTSKLPAKAPARRLLRRDERQASILREAAAAFARSGYAATSMEDVAEACGVTKLIVYRHFGSKEELYRAILQRVFDRQAEELVAGLARGSQRGVGVRTLLTVAREDPPAVVLLWRHAARETAFADYADEQRAVRAGRPGPHGHGHRRPRLRPLDGRGGHRLARRGGAGLARGG